MERKRKEKTVILIIGIVLIGLAGYLYYKQETAGNKGKRSVSNTTTEEEGEWDSEIVNLPLVTEEEEKKQSITEEAKQEASTTTEKKQNVKLPDNYEWDEKQWGEPPQIIYDFAENQEKFDFIVNEVDSILSEGEGFSTRRNNEKLYSESENGEQLKEDIDYLLNNTLFYKIIKEEYGYWIIEYDQEEDRHVYIYAMRYVPGMTEEEAWDNGYIKVVGDWYFAPIWI